MIFAIIILFIIGIFTIKPRFTIDPKRLTFANTLNWRGILTIIVILHHLCNNMGMGLYDTIPCIILPHMGYICVGIFLFLSGYGLESTRVNQSRGSLINKCIFFLIIYFAINLLGFITSPSFSEFIDYQDSFYKFINGLYNGKPIVGSSWFLIDIVLLYISYYISSSFQNYECLVLICLQLILLVFYNSLNYAGIWYFSNLCFPAGVIFRRYQSVILGGGRATNWIIVISSLLLVLSFLLKKLFLSEFVGIVSTITTSLSLSVIAILSLTTIEFKGRIWSFIGKYSLEIFLIHVIIYKILRGRVFYLQDDFMFCTLTIILSLICSIPLSIINKKLKKAIYRI